MASPMKKPVGGAYGVFLAEKREGFKAKLQAENPSGTVPITAVTKMASAEWKALGEKDKAGFEAKYQEKLEKYKAYKESDDYVPPEKKEKRGDKKAPKDKDAPKRPAGGAYGQFMNEKREEFKKKAVAAGDNSFGGPAKLASEAWKGMGEKEKEAYQKKYEVAKKKYDEDMAAYKASKPDAVEEEEEEGEAPSPSPAKGTKRKAAAEKADKAQPKKKAAKPAQAEPVKLDAAVLKEADGLGYRTQLENLAQRKEIAATGFDGPKLLRAIKASGGLVNKAKAALLGA